MLNWLYKGICALAQKRKRSMAIAILLGAILGVVGFIPLFIGLRLTRRVTATSNFGYMSILIISLIVSFVLLFVFAALFFGFDHDNGIPFLFAEVVALSAAAIGFALWQMLRR